MVLRVLLLLYNIQYCTLFTIIQNSVAFIVEHWAQSEQSNERAWEMEEWWFLLLAENAVDDVLHSNLSVGKFFVVVKCETTNDALRLVLNWSVFPLNFLFVYGNNCRILHLPSTINQLLCSVRPSLCSKMDFEAIIRFHWMLISVHNLNYLQKHFICN